MVVRNVIAHMVDTVAERVGMDAEEAIHLVTSEAVADAIVAAADQSIEGSWTHARSTRRPGSWDAW